MAKRILVCGVDKTLVETRRAILTHAGYDVSACTAEIAADRMLGLGEVDLLILCSSLSCEQRRHLLDLSHKTRPEQKSLIVISGNRDHHLSSSIDIPFPAFDGPARFVMQVNSLLAT